MAILAYYAGIMLNAFALTLCSKLCCSMAIKWRELYDRHNPYNYYITAKKPRPLW